MAAPEGSAGQALTFRAAGELLAIGAGQVSEVIRRPKLTRVPLAPPSLAGVANLRGAVIPVVSVAALLGDGDGGCGGAAANRVIVVRNPDPVGLLVDDVAVLVPLEGVGSAGGGARLIDVTALLGDTFAAGRKERGQVAGAGVGAARAAAKAVEREAFLSFGVGGQAFALPLDSVREVLALPKDVSAVPRTDDAMLGVMPLRNRLLPLLSLQVLLGLEASPAASRVVVAMIGGARVGLVVEAVREIMRAGQAEIDPVPPVLTRGRQEAQIRAICRLDGGRRLVSILSTDHLLRDGLAERLAGEEDEGDGMAARTEGETEQFVIFRLGEERYGVPIASVEEVVALPSKLTRLPRAPAFVEGVFSLRGRVIPVIDQRQRFDVTGGKARRARVLVVRMGETRAGFIVDEVSEVLRVGAGQMRDAPELGGASARVIDRIANLEGEAGMIPIIDPQELLDRAERDILGEFQSDPEVA